MSMPKDFDSWNKKKKKIHAESENKYYKPREIWWCALGTNVGFEQDGTGEDNGRPVLIIVGFSKEVCLVVPLTTSKKHNKYYIDIGKVVGKGSSAIISQVRLIDTKRFINKLGVLDETTFRKIRKAVKDLI